MGSIIDFIKDKQDKISKESDELKDRRYRIEIDYKIALVKNPKKADIVLAKGDLDTPMKGILIKVARDIASTHPFRSKELVEEVNKGISGRKITSYDIQSIVYVEKIKKKPEFHYYREKLTPRLYSQKFVDFIINKIDRSPNYLNKVRKSYKIYLDKVRERNREKKLKRNNLL